MLKGDKGFTIIELVVVIVLLGILAGAALPRFIDLHTSAIQSTAEGFRGAFASGVNQAQAKFTAGGGVIGQANSVVDMSGDGNLLGFTSDGNGFPSVVVLASSTYNISTMQANFANASDCANLAQEVLQNSSWSVRTVSAGKCALTSGLNVCAEAYTFGSGNPSNACRYDFINGPNVYTVFYSPTAGGVQPLGTSTTSALDYVAQ